jgi:hypothetical protein
LFLGIAPDGIVPASLRIVDIAVLGQHNTPLQGLCPFVTLAFEQTVGPIRDLRLHGMPKHLSDKHARTEYPSRRHTTPYLRFYFLALNKGTCHCVQIEEWYTGFILVSWAWIDLMDVWLRAMPLHVLGALLAEVWGSRRRSEWRMIRFPSLSAWCRAS